jgi:hypothetical protein
MDDMEPLPEAGPEEPLPVQVKNALAELAQARGKVRAGWERSLAKETGQSVAQLRKEA